MNIRFPMLVSMAALALLVLSGAPAANAQNHPTKASKATAARANITANQATHAALKKYPGSVEGKVALENEDGAWQYAVNVRSGKTLREVMVDAHSGKIASVEVTSKAEERKEAAAEARKPAKAHTGHKNAGATGEKNEAGETSGK